MDNFSFDDLSFTNLNSDVSFDNDYWYDLGNLNVNIETERYRIKELDYDLLNLYTRYNLINPGEINSTKLVYPFLEHLYDYIDFIVPLIKEMYNYFDGGIKDISKFFDRYLLNILAKGIDINILTRERMKMISVKNQTEKNLLHNYLGEMVIRKYGVMEFRKYEEEHMQTYVSTPQITTQPVNPSSYTRYTESFIEDIDDLKNFPNEIDFQLFLKSLSPSEITEVSLKDPLLHNVMYISFYIEELSDKYKYTNKDNKGIFIPSIGLNTAEQYKDLLLCNKKLDDDICNFNENIFRAFENSRNLIYKVICYYPIMNDNIWNRAYRVLNHMKFQIKVIKENICNPTIMSSELQNLLRKITRYLNAYFGIGRKVMDRLNEDDAFNVVFFKRFNPYINQYRLIHKKLSEKLFQPYTLEYTD